MRILFLTTEFPWPPIGGGPVRTLSQIKVLASFAEVERITLVSVAERDVPAGACNALAATVPKLRVIPPIFHPIHLWKHPRWIPRVVALRARRIPYVVAK